MPPSRLRRFFILYFRGIRFSTFCYIFALIAFLSLFSLVRLVLESKEERRVVCVTGAGGFLGFHLIRQLTGAVPVVGVELHSKDPLQRKRLELLKQGGIQVGNLDVADSTRLSSFLLIQKVGVLVDFTQHEKEYSGEYNARLMESLMVSGLRAKVKHLFFASPNRYYIPSSRSGEAFLGLHRDRLPFPVTEFRMSTVYGSYGRRDMPYYSFTSQIMDHKTIFIVADTLGLQDYVEVNDAVRGMKEIILGGHTPRTIIDIWSGRSPVSKLELIALLCNITNQVQPKIQRPRGAGSPPFEPKFTAPEYPWLIHTESSLYMGLQNFVRWYKQEGFKYKKIPAL